MYYIFFLDCVFFQKLNIDCVLNKKLNTDFYSTVMGELMSACSLLMWSLIAMSE
jgi:hypothetical protein